MLYRTCNLPLHNDWNVNGSIALAGISPLKLGITTGPVRFTSSVPRVFLSVRRVMRFKHRTLSRLKACVSITSA